MRAAHLAKWCFYYSRMTIPTDRPDVEAMLPIGCEPIEVILSLVTMQLTGAKNCSGLLSAGELAKKFSKKCSFQERSGHAGGQCPRGALAFTVASLNLGSVIPGNSSTMSATLMNDSAGAVNITGVSIAPAGGTFTSTNNCPATLSPKQTCVFSVTFWPPDTGNYSATLTVTDNGTGSPATLALSGIGLD